MGEEAVSCAFRRALEPGDMNFPTYRQAGLLIAGGYPMVEMMNQIFSNEEDPLKGRAAVRIGVCRCGDQTSRGIVIGDETPDDLDVFVHRVSSSPDARSPEDDVPAGGRSTCWSASASCSRCLAR